MNSFSFFRFLKVDTLKRMRSSYIMDLICTNVCRSIKHSQFKRKQKKKKTKRKEEVCNMYWNMFAGIYTNGCTMYIELI